MRHGRPARPTLALTLLVLAATAAQARAEDPYVSNDRFGTRVAPLLLLSRPDVQNDMGLSAQQAQSAKQAIHDIHARALALRGQPDTAETIAARREIDQSQMAWLGSELNEDQQLRLRQLDLQWEGLSALLTRPSVATTLALTPQQKTDLAQIFGDRAQLRANTTFTAQQEADFTSRAFSVLDQNQRQLWQSLCGPAFSIRPAAAASATATNAGGSIPR